MTKKKNNKSNLEKKRILFLEMGFVIALATMLVAFEWGSKDPLLSEIDINLIGNVEEVWEIPSIKREKPKVKPPIVPKEILIIDNSLPDIDIPNIIFEKDDLTTVYVFDFPEEPIVDTLPFYTVQQMPRYKKSDKSAFQKHLQQLVRYPIEAQEANIQGKVFIQFVVDENGSVSRQEIVKSPHPSLSNAVLGAMNKTDKWTPGEQWGKKVKVSFTIPVNFVLNN